MTTIMENFINELAEIYNLTEDEKQVIINKANEPIDYLFKRDENMTNKEYVEINEKFFDILKNN